MYVLDDAREAFELADEFFYGKPFTEAEFYHHIRDLRLDYHEEDVFLPGPGGELVEFVVRRPRIRINVKGAENVWVNRAAARFIRWRFPYWRNEP